MKWAQRYSVNDDGEMVASDSGSWVEYAYYEYLKAEVERLRASSFVTAVPVEEYEKLKAEVERLRKAGDAMLPFFIYPPYEKGSHKAVLNWNAAKEGKQP